MILSGVDPAIVAVHKDVFTTENKKVGLAKIGEPFSIELLPGSQPVKSPDWGFKPIQIEILKQQFEGLDCGWGY